LILLLLNGLAGEPLADQLVACLDQIGDTDIEQTSLAAVVQRLDAVFEPQGTDFTVHLTDLRRAGMDDDEIPIDLHWKGVSFRTALLKAIEPLDLTLYVEAGRVLISTKAALREFIAPAIAMSYTEIIVEFPPLNYRSRLGGQLLFILPWGQPREIDSRAGVYAVPKRAAIFWVTDAQLLLIDVAANAGVVALAALLIIAGRRRRDRRVTTADDMDGRG
jgi:hypothetical protein